MSPDDESTPHRKHPTEDLNVIDMVTRQLRDVSRKVERGEQQNTEILVSLARIEGHLSVGNTKFDGHHSRLDALEKRGDKSTWALLTAAFAIIGHLINYIIHGGKS